MLSSEIVVFIYILWFLAVLFWLLRRGIELIWKLAAVAAFAAHLYFQYPVFLKVWQEIESDYVQFLMKFTVSLGKTFFELWSAIWMIVMVAVFYMVNELAAEKWVKTLFFLTLLVWAIWFVNFFYGKEIGEYLGKEIPAFFPRNS